MKQKDNFNTQKISHTKKLPKINLFFNLLLLFIPAIILNDTNNQLWAKEKIITILFLCFLTFITNIIFIKDTKNITLSALIIPFTLLSLFNKSSFAVNYFTFIISVIIISIYIIYKKILYKEKPMQEIIESILFFAIIRFGLDFAQYGKNITDIKNFFLDYSLIQFLLLNSVILLIVSRLPINIEKH